MVIKAFTESVRLNMGFAIAGVTCFVETFVVGESVVLRMNGSANSPRHRKPLKRYRLFCDDRATTDRPT